MRTMFDAVTVDQIPATATLVAGYVDGHYANIDAMHARFPHATVVPIAVSWRTNGGTVLDCEAGDATPSECPAWVTMRRARGVDPTVYCSADVWPAVRAAFQGAHIPEPHYWIAQWDGVADIPAGAVAKQYRNDPGYDLSAVADHWPGVDPAKPIPVPTPTPTPGDTVTPQDYAEIAKAVWYYETQNVENGQATPMEAYLRYGDYLRHQQTTQVLDALGKVTATLEALSAAVAKLAPAPHAAAAPPAAALEPLTATPAGDVPPAAENAPQTPAQSPADAAPAPAAE